MNNIGTRVKTIRDIMRKDSGVDGDAQRISQLVWMLFLKIYSDKERTWKQLDKNFKSPIPNAYKWENWTSISSNLSDESLIEFINTGLFPALKAIKQKTGQAKLVRTVFEDTHNYMKNGNLVRQVIVEINKINFSNDTQNHVFNDIYENILKELQSAGSSGEYYTPRPVTQFMVEMINPKPKEVVLDPACGTGGFLTCTINNILKHHTVPKVYSSFRSNIRGVEKKSLPYLLCATNLMLHGVDEPAIIRGNLLTKSLQEWSKDGEVDVILSNPPFGGLEENGTEDNFPSDFRTKETADLFMVLIMQLLKRNGRAAVILPDGFLFGTGVRTRIKQELLTTCNLHTIVRLPNGIFSPYTNIKTNLLFFDKGKPTKEIWYFEHQYPEGQKTYNKSRPVTSKEFDIEREWWNNRVDTEFAWKVGIGDIIKRNYNLDINSPYYGEGDEILSSTEIISRLNKSLQRTQEILSSFQTSI